ncbi:MAG TPA: hypothetical protein VE843_03140 [Ktedonobacteraceae bacterium]|nr:hypothetical protein [Ktedonobacteraceae bacterium]
MLRGYGRRQGIGFALRLKLHDIQRAKEPCGGRQGSRFALAIETIAYEL